MVITIDRRATAAGLACGVLGAVGLLVVPASGSQDPGQVSEQNLASHSAQYFGVGQPLDSSSAASISAAEASADPTHLVTLAQGLTAQVVSANAAPPNLDQMVLWPRTNPQWIIACNEQGTADPGVVRISLATGASTTIVTGTTECDPVRATPWGTVLFGEEAGGGANGGAMYELLDPAGTTGVSLDRSTGAFTGGTGATNLVRRDALGRLSFEGLAIYPNGVTYYGDENRPSSGAAGGAYFKFVPTHPLTPGTTSIASLDDSPLAAGSIYGLRLGLRNGGTDYGQGTQTGRGSWVAVAGSDLRAAAATLHLTGYYRPEDADIDGAAAQAGRVRFCGNNTGNEADDGNWGETLCITDGTLADATAGSSVPTAQYLVLGNPAFAMPDNIAYQASRRNWIIHEDADTTAGYPHNDDLWDCLGDGADADLQSDGCIRIGTLNDLTAEWTGGFFDATGQHFYVSVQHNVSGAGTILDITGWK